MQDTGVLPTSLQPGEGAAGVGLRPFEGAGLDGQSVHRVMEWWGAGLIIVIGLSGLDVFLGLGGVAWRLAPRARDHHPSNI